MAAGLTGLGVDAGGTKTAVVVMAADGRVLGRGQGGPANPRFVSEAEARRSIGEAVRKALGDAGCRAGDVDRAVTGGPAGEGLLRAVLAAELPGVPVRHVGEAALALAAGGIVGPGGAVVAGTGSLAAARRATGDWVIVGGWGTVMGDEGSAYAIGRAALRAVARAADGRGRATGLTARMQAWAGVGQTRAVIDRVYHPATSRRDIAALAREVDEEARAGDPVARSILTQAGRALAGQIATALRRAGLAHEPVPVSAVGGVLLASDRVLSAVVEALGRRCPSASVFRARRSLAEAAAWWAAGGGADHDGGPVSW